MSIALIMKIKEEIYLPVLRNYQKVFTIYFFYYILVYHHHKQSSVFQFFHSDMKHLWNLHTIKQWCWFWSQWLFKKFCSFIFLPHQKNKSVEQNTWFDVYSIALCFAKKFGLLSIDFVLSRIVLEYFFRRTFLPTP